MLKSVLTKVDPREHLRLWGENDSLKKDNKILREHVSQLSTETLESQQIIDFTALQLDESEKRITILGRKINNLEKQNVDLSKKINKLEEGKTNCCLLC